jgi:hypothetical protein
LNTYNNANKIFNLVKGLPIGIVTWGAGSIGLDSIATLIKDLRIRVSTRGNASAIDRNNYTIEGVANIVREFIFTEKYLLAFQNWPQKPDISLIVAGYSSGASMADEYQIIIRRGECDEPRLLRQNQETGATWGGINEVLNRLMLGFSPKLPAALQASLNLSEPQFRKVMLDIQTATAFPLVMPAMPLQDAIDLAEFMVDLTIKWVRFAPGAPTVAGPIEIAAISKHEGFRWIRRKHYFDKALNPDIRLDD